MLNLIIRKQRENLNYSQSYIAEYLDIARPTYSDIEKGKREITLSEVKKLSEVLELPIESFIEGKMPEEINIEVIKSPTKKSENIRISIPQRNLDKFREVLLYILVKVGAKPNVGETVIYKLLYFIDFDYYEKYEEQLIGATYQKNHFGPTPLEFQKLIKDMQKKGEIDIVKNKYFNNDQKKYLAVRNPDLSKLISAQELEHINEVLNRLSDKNASELSAYSHLDVPWISAEAGKIIDYESVFYRTPKTSVRKYNEDGISNNT